MGKRKRVEQPTPVVDEDSADEQVQNTENGKWTLADRRLIVLLEGAQLETVKVYIQLSFYCIKFVFVNILRSLNLFHVILEW